MRATSRPWLGLAGALLLGLRRRPWPRRRTTPGREASGRRGRPPLSAWTPSKLAEAVKFAQAHEVDWLRDVGAQIEKDVVSEPYPQVLGETKERGGPAGMILRYGYMVASWGDIDRVDMSFSIAKSYLSTIAGLAVDRGLIKEREGPGVEIRRGRRL